MTSPNLHRYGQISDGLTITVVTRNHQKTNMSRSTIRCNPNRKNLRRQLGWSGRFVYSLTHTEVTCSGPGAAQVSRLCDPEEAQLQSRSNGPEGRRASRFRLTLRCSSSRPLSPDTRHSFNTSSKRMPLCSRILKCRSRWREGALDPP